MMKQWQKYHLVIKDRSGTLPIWADDVQIWMLIRRVVGYFPVVFFKYRRGDHKHLARWLAVCSTSTLVSHSGLMIRDNSTTKAIKDEGDLSFPASTNFTVWCFQPHQPTVSNVSQTSLVKWQIVFFFWMERTTLKHQPKAHSRCPATNTCIHMYT